MDPFTAIMPGWAWAVLAVLILALLGLAPWWVGRVRAGRVKGFVPGASPNGGAAVSRPIVHAPVEMVSYDQVNREYERRRVLSRQTREELASLQAEVDRLDYRKLAADQLLDCAGHEERSNLRVILGLGPNATSTVMVDALRRAGSHGVASLVRGGHVPYEEVVKDVALKLGAKPPHQQ